jgi:transposase
MIHAGFLSAAERSELRDLARSGKIEHRIGRRANALILLDRGMSHEDVASILLIDDDTVRTWHNAFREDGIRGLSKFGYVGSYGLLTEEQEENLKAWVGGTLPRSTRMVGAWIEQEFDVVYQSKSGLLKLLDRLDCEFRKPTSVSKKLDPEKQKAFIRAYDDLLNSMADDEVALFADAVHPTHAARPVGCWAPKETKVAIDQTNGRERLNVHGAVNLETGQTNMIDVLTVDALSTITLLMAIEAAYPQVRIIHLFLDNARYHHAKLVKEWLAQPGRRIKLHFIPAYCPHLNPIERLWGLMHRNVTHNKCYSTYREFASAMLTFLRAEVPAKWNAYCDSVSDSFRVIDPKGFRILT